MWNNARLLNLIANILVVWAIIIALGTALLWAIKRPAFNLIALELKSASEEPLHYISVSNIRSSFTGRLKGNFFTVNLNEVRKLFESAPWVRHASVRRIWPNMLRIQIEEQRPLALWNDTQMINTWGEPFTANMGDLEDDLVLPQFSGPQGTHALVVQRYAELARWFAPLDWHLKALDLSARYAWRATLSNGMSIDLGRDPGADAPDPHGPPGALPFAARIQRFVQAWPALMEKLEQQKAIQVDLRYSNGFAIMLAPSPHPTSKPSPTHSKKRN